MGILEAAASMVRSAYHSTKGNIPIQMVFVRDMILSLNKIEYWKYICQCKEAQTEKDFIKKTPLETTTITELRIQS